MLEPLRKRQAHYQELEFQRVHALFADWSRDRNAPLKVLDYGCGRGKYLKLFGALGLEAHGVDINPAYVNEGQAAGFAVLHDAEMDSRAGSYDVVFLSHLIEHLHPDELVMLFPRLCAMLAAGGRIVILTPVAGERFYHDFSHIRPYYPQSIRHAFGQHDAPLSFAAQRLIELKDIYFFRDPYRTRTWRSFYAGPRWQRRFVDLLNRSFDLLWYASGGRIGTLASWMGVYEAIGASEGASTSD